MSKLNFDSLKKYNWLVYPDYNGDGIERFFYVKQIDFDHETIRVSDGRFQLLTSFSQLQHIPISIEWLEKFGYKQLKRVEKTYSLSSFEDNSSICIVGNKFIHISTSTRLDYVHELQNLYSAIFKKELKYHGTNR